MKDYPSIAKELNGFENDFNAWLAASKSYMADKNSQAKQTNSEQAFATLRIRLDKAGELAEKTSEQEIITLSSNIISTKMMMLTVVAIILIAASWFSYIVPKQLTRQINYVTKRISDIASGDGDLTGRIQVTSKDEFSDLATEFNTFLDNLQQLIRDILEQSKELNSLGVELSKVATQNNSVNQALGQASESIVSAVHEMSTASKEVAGVAQQSSSEADNSLKLAQQRRSAVANSSSRITSLLAT
jgi:Methyl-accepting chemotaxis protein